MSFDLLAFENRTPQCRGKVFYQDAVGSTNNEARRDILAGKASSGNIYLTEFQTNGRGRGVNRWVCPAGEGLLFSLVVDPDVAPELWYRMSLSVGMAVLETLGELGIEAQLKWPNDIYVNDKKLGGILIEKVNNLLILGVGLNVNVREFPEEVAGRASSLALELNHDVEREVLLASLVGSIYRNGSLIGDSFNLLLKSIMESKYLTS